MLLQNNDVSQPGDVWLYFCHPQPFLWLIILNVTLATQHTALLMLIILDDFGQPGCVCPTPYQMLFSHETKHFKDLDGLM